MGSASEERASDLLAGKRVQSITRPEGERSVLVVFEEGPRPNIDVTPAGLELSIVRGPDADPEQ